MRELGGIKYQKHNIVWLMSIVRALVVMKFVILTPLEICWGPDVLKIIHVDNIYNGTHNTSSILKTLHTQYYI